MLRFNALEYVVPEISRAFMPWYFQTMNLAEYNQGSVWAHLALAYIPEYLRLNPM
jgi:hypothetical protein